MDFNEESAPKEIEPEELPLEETESKEEVLDKTESEEEPTLEKVESEGTTKPEVHDNEEALEETQPEEDEPEEHDNEDSSDDESESEEVSGVVEEIPAPVIVEKKPLKLFLTQLWGEEPVVFKTSFKRGDDGFYLALTIASILHDYELLSRVEVKEEDDAWKDYSVSVVNEKLPAYQIHDVVYKKYDPDTLITLYDQLNGRSASSLKVLNLWMRAWSGDSTELFEVIQKSQSLPVLASLVERGANPLLAMKL